jgi:hypothetical protein
MICMMVAGNEPQTPSFLPFQSARAFHAFVAVHADARCNSESTGAKKCQVDQFQSNHSSIPTMTFVVIVMVHLLISSPSSRHPWSWRYRGTPPGVFVSETVCMGARVTYAAAWRPSRPWWPCRILRACSGARTSS